MTQNITTDAELADMLGISVEDVRLKCRHEWPALRPKRSVWRFTESMVEEILLKSAVLPARPTVGRQRRRAA